MAETVQLVRDHAAEFHGVAAWPAQPKLVPTVIVCESAPTTLHIPPTGDYEAFASALQKRYCSLGIARCQLSWCRGVKRGPSSSAFTSGMSQRLRCSAMIGQDCNFTSVGMETGTDAGFSFSWLGGEEQWSDLEALVAT